MEEQNQTRKVKKVEDLTFTDDGMFQAVLHEPDLCAELVERLLHVKVSHVEYPELEEQIAPYFSCKGVRLDVYLKDSDKVIDVEMQTIVKPSLGKRLRYYQSMIDIDSLMKGQDYSELKESYILFICKEDPFKYKDGNPHGLSCYTFKNICLEKNDVELHDNALKVVYNANAYEKEKDEKIRNFLHFVNTNEPGTDDFSSRLSATVARLKTDDEFRSTYKAMNLRDMDIRRDALKEGREEKAVESSIELLKEGISPEVIARCVKLPLEQVLKLQTEINK